MGDLQYSVTFRTLAAAASKLTGHRVGHGGSTLTGPGACAPLRPELLGHALELHPAVEALDHVRAGAGVLGQQEHVHAGYELLADVEVPEGVGGAPRAAVVGPN